MSKRSAQPIVRVLPKETLLSVAKASVGSAIFRHLFATVNGTKRDILRDGEVSCAFFVSWLLMGLELIKHPHATVSGTVKDLEASGWEKIRKPRTACVIVWSGVLYPDGELHKHVGIYVGNNTAISNSTTTKTPQMHHWRLIAPGNKRGRPIEALYWHPKFS